MKFLLAAPILLLIVAGCEPSYGGTSSPNQPAPPSAAKVAPSAPQDAKTTIEKNVPPAIPDNLAGQPK